MRPISLTATNYVRFPSLAVTFAEGSCAVTGPNGAGKSAVLRAPDVALFADGSKDLARWLAPFNERMELLLEFEHAGERYRVRRTYKGGASAKATLDLDRLEASDAWLPLTLASTKETQAELERILGLNRRTFAASSYLAQGNDGSLTKATPAERKDLIASAIDPRGYWPGVAQKASEERKACERALEADRIRIEERATFLAADGNDVIEERLENALGEQQLAEGDLSSADDRLAMAQTAVAGNAAAVERLKAAQAAEGAAKSEHARAFNALEEARGFAEKLEPARSELVNLNLKADMISFLEAELEAQRTARTEQAAAQASSAAANAHADQLNAARREAYAKGQQQMQDHLALTHRIEHLEAAAEGSERCALCEQTLGIEARVATLSNLGDQLQALNVAMLEHAPTILRCEREAKEAGEAADAIVIPELPPLVDIEAPLASARRAAEQRGTITLLIQGYEEHGARIPELLNALGEADGWLKVKAAESARLAAEAKDDAELKQAAESARSRQTQARAALDAANAAVTRLEEQLARVKQAEAELEALRGASRLRQSDLDLLRLAERAFGRDGIPTLIVETMLAQIETNANTYLAMMPTRGGRVTLRVELETQAKQKTVEHLKETLDIMVCDADTRRHYESFSGSEQSRLDFALGLSLAILLADRRGAESRVLLLDELEGLDEQGQRDVVKVVESVRSRFDLILVASHYQGIRDAFDQVLSVVVDDDDVSRIAA